MKKPFKQLDSKIAWACDWYDVRQDSIELPDGSIGQYNVVRRETAVFIIPITPDNEIVMLHQYRYTVDDYCWEIPAGGVKAGQTLEEAARDELREEIGGTTEQLEYGGQFYTANGFCDEIGHYFIAKNVIMGETAHEPAESMQVHTKPIAQVLRMVRNHEVTDGQSALILLLAEPHLRAMIKG